jgi:hypothetical protein
MRKLLLAVLLLSISCTNPLCGCTPAPMGVWVRGTLQNAGGDPLGGQRVRAEAAFGGCLEYEPTSSAVTNAAGGFDFLVLVPVRDSICLRFFARDTSAGAVESALGGVLRARAMAYPYDTLEVAFTPAPVIR